MRTVAFLCIVVFILLAAGCWDYAEYEDMALISAIGIDYTEETNHVEITLENSSVGRKGEASQSSQGGEKNKSGSRELYAVDAESIPEAINKLQQAEERELFFGYTQVVVISSEAAEKYMKEILSFLSYTPRIRKSVYLFVTPKSAQDVLRSVERSETSPAAHRIIAFTQQSKRNATFFPVTLREFNIALTTKGMQPVVPLITVKPSNAADGANESAGSSVVPGDVEEEPGDLQISGMGVFKEEKLIGWLDGIESTGLGIILGKDISNYIAIKSEDLSIGILNFRVRKVSTGITTDLENDRVAVGVKVNVKWGLEQYEPSSGTLNPDTIKELEMELEKSVKKIVNASLEKGQKELGSDIFAFGNVLYRQHAKEWDNSYEEKWDALFPEMPVDVEVKSQILDAGLAIKPMQRR